MKRLKPKDNVKEVKCPACDGTGFPKVKQPIEASRKIYPAPCKNVRARVELNRRARAWREVAQDELLLNRIK
jgi:hypothetical protein